MLLERRIGGWTVTFPAGGAAERELKNKKYPGFARALARCAALPPSLRETDRAGAGNGAHRSDSAGKTEASESSKESA